MSKNEPSSSTMLPFAAAVTGSMRGCRPVNTSASGGASRSRPRARRHARSSSGARASCIDRSLSQFAPSSRCSHWLLPSRRGRRRWVSEVHRVCGG